MDKLKLLLNALRSNKYKKCKNALSKNDCYCVEGVACEVAINNGCKTKKKEYTIGTGKYCEYDEAFYYAPVSVVRWYEEFGDGLFRKVENEEKTLNLVYLNDKLDLTFPQIADIIEKHFNEK